MGCWALELLAGATGKRKVLLVVVVVAVVVELKKWLLRAGWMTKKMVTTKTKTRTKTRTKTKMAVAVAVAAEHDVALGRLSENASWQKRKKK